MVPFYLQELKPEKNKNKDIKCFAIKMIWQSQTGE